ncbi:hypothetical protein BZJ17_11260 [Salinivibrio sp. IB574]|uniref:hypothetical protein n=1 Tax=Salinivibrio sp. IB574 TaxID=1909444 RepID=UPI000988B9E9|nr:hypothetical protein [Salinivibrio sp. IB574]OOF20771.1 hypothetical protein BZJ17_11260 [Salinivibrio sp. IB574]
MIVPLTARVFLCHLLVVGWLQNNQAVRGLIKARALYDILADSVVIATLFGIYITLKYQAMLGSRRQHA